MQRSVVKGILFIIAGVACIFPFIRVVIVENLAIMLGVYLTYRGFLYLTATCKKGGNCCSQHRNERDE
jgi:uncharacterized membrane protein HdeD (DUF308 family)